MTRTRVTALVAGAALAVGSTLAAAVPAQADDANPYDPGFVPAADDIVGTGSDTTQIVMHGLADAYNASPTRTAGKLASFSAEGLPANIVLRAGSTAIVRPNNSGKGRALLFNPSDPNANFARSSGSIADSSNATEKSSLLQAAFAVDGLKMAVASSATNAPAKLTGAQIVSIYKGDVTNWSAVGGTAGVIKPYIPKAGSGTRSFFEGQLKALNGGTAVTLGSAVSETQEHDPTDIQSNPNAIAPFSTARAKSSATIKLLAGTSAGGWDAKRPVYNVVRKSDLEDASPVKAKLNEIFGPTGFICGTEGRTAIEAAGFDQLASVSDGGACGQFVSDTVGNLRTSSQAGASASTTTLSATVLAGKKVKLVATVASSAGTPNGDVTFYDGATALGDSVSTAGGVAEKTVDATVGSHAYTAKFVPSDDGEFTTSTSAEQAVTVKTPTSVTATGRGTSFGVATSVTVTAKADGAPATGSVLVKVGAAAERAYALSSAGTVAVPIPAGTPAGAVRVSAKLAGTSTTDEATASTTVTVAKGRSAASAKLAKAKIKKSKRGVVTVRVSAPRNASTGTVIVKAGRKVVGRGSVRGGVSTIKLAKLKKGTYRLVATYSGNANVSGVTARTVTLKVTK